MHTRLRRDSGCHTFLRTCVVIAALLLGGPEGAALLHGQKDQFEPLQIGPSASIVGDSSGNVWIATERDGVTRYHPKTRYKAFRDGLPSTRVHVVFLDRDGKLLAGTSKGAARLDEGRFERFPDAEINRSEVRALAQDKEGSYWFCTNKGPFTFDGQSARSVSGAPGALDNATAICLAASGNLWFATTEGAVRFDGTDYQTYTTQQGLPSNRVNAVLQAGPDLLLGTSQGLVRFADSRFESFPPGQGLTDDVRAVYYDRSGRYWFGTNQGIFYHERDQTTPLELDQSRFAPTRVVALAEDSGGDLWLGTDDMYVARLTPPALPALPTPIPKPTPDPVLALVGEAKELSEAGKWSQAASKYRQVLDEFDPANREAIQGLVTALLTLGLQREQGFRFEDAIQYLNQAQLLQSDNPQVTSALKRVRNRQEQEKVNQAYRSALDHLKAKRWTDAIRNLDDLLELDPGNADVNGPKVDAYLGLAEEQRLAGQTAAAVGSFNSILRLDPRNQTALLALQTIRRREEQQGRQEEAESAFREGQELLESSAWGVAISKFRDALNLVSSYQPARDGLHRAYIAQGRQFLKLKDWDQALASFEFAGSFGEAPAELIREARIGKLHADGMQALESEQWDIAKKHFDELLRLQPEDRDTKDRLAEVEVGLLFSTGLALYNDQKWESARAQFVQVIQRVQDLRPVLERASRISQEAVNWIQRIEQGVDQRVIEDSVERANEYLAEENWDRASEAFDRIIGEYGNITAAVEGLKKAKEEQERVRLAEEERSRQQRRQQQRLFLALGVAGALLLAAAVYLWSPLRRARLFSSLGRLRSAANIYEKLLERNPTDASALLPLGDLYPRLGEEGRLTELYESYLRVKPDDVEVLSQAGDRHFEHHNHVEALAIYHRILKLGQGEEQVYRRLLEIHDQIEVPGEGLEELYRQALDTETESPELNLLLARVYLKLGRIDLESLGVYKRALGIEADNLDLRLALARGSLIQGRLQEAVEESRQILDRDADHEPARAILLESSRRTDSLDQAFEILKSYDYSPFSLLQAFESILEVEPRFRPEAQERYRQVLETLPEDAPEGPLFVAHIALTDGDTALASEQLERAEEASNSVEGTAAGRRDTDAFLGQLIRGNERLLEQTEVETSTPASNPERVFRLAHLYQRYGDWSKALTSFQKIVAIPEWEVRARKRQEEILDRLPIVDVTAKFFDSIPWTLTDVEGNPHASSSGSATEFALNGSDTQASGEGSSEDSSSSAEQANDLVVDPPKPFRRKIYSFFERTWIRCFERPIRADDIVQLQKLFAGLTKAKQEGMERTNEVNTEIAFVVGPGRPRQDVFALIYGMMSEEPPLTVIPLESPRLKEAMINLKASESLEELLYQWLGQGDLYDVHNPIADAATFFGRGQMINRLTTKIIQRENFGIFGLRKVGKTSLIFQLRENLPKTLIAYVDLQSIASKRCEEVYFRLIEALSREMRVKFPHLSMPTFGLGTYDPREEYPEIATDFHNDLLQLKTLLEQDGEQPRVLLLLDEIELLVPSEGSGGVEGYDGFLRQIRGLYQQESFILSGVVGADPGVCRKGKWGDRDNPMFQYYDEVFLTPLEPAECNQMVQGIGEMMGTSYDAASLDRIYHESGGHPYVARQLCSRIVSRHRDRPLEVNEDMVCEGVDDYISQRADYFQGVFRGYISDHARKILEMASMDQEHLVSRSQLKNFAESEGFDTDQLARALQDLELFHLLTREQEMYSIKINLLRLWIRHSWLGMD